MKFSKEMILLSKSGYAMPFEDKEHDIVPTLGYGQQKHPMTGETFFHHGCDFAAHRALLSAVADGMVKDMGFDTTHGQYIVMRHGGYEVTYAHLSKVYASVGETVRAGNVVGVSDDMVHIAASYNDTELDPMAFLAMILQNLLVVSRNGRQPTDQCYSIDLDIKTDYDDRKEEVENLMLRFWADYYEAIGQGRYTTPDRTRQSMQHLFAIGQEKELYGEQPPSLLNPLGLWKRAALLIGRIQSLLIADFLNYLAITNQVYLSGTDDDSKKKRLTKPLPTD